MVVTFRKISDLRSVAGAWQALERESRPSVFQSWSWIGPWLHRAVKSEELVLCRVSDGKELVGLAVLTLRIQRNRRLFPVKTLYLNESGPESLDFCIEYNGVLAKKGREMRIWETLLRELSRWDYPWEELVIRRVNRNGNGLQNLPSGILEDAGLERLLIDTTESPFVDLEHIRKSGKEFIQTLSRNRRAQIRHGLRTFQTYGELDVTPAASASEAQQFFTELMNLHQAYWNRKGQPGAFAKPIAQEFHKEIIEDQFPRGGVQMLKVTAGDLVLGYVYCLVRNGWVYMIQTGFNYLDSRTRPGEISHFLAIVWNLEQGSQAYDFLGGTSRYKSSLSTGCNQLDTIVLRRRSLKLSVEERVRRIYRKAVY